MPWVLWQAKFDLATSLCTLATDVPSLPPSLRGTFVLNRAMGTSKASARSEYGLFFRETDTQTTAI